VRQFGEPDSCDMNCVCFEAMTDQPGDAPEREPYRVAAKVFDTLLTDQISRADSLNATAGVFAGLGGVVTTLAGIVTGLDAEAVGKAGVSLAGASVVLAVVALITRRPGREPIELDRLLHRILNTGDTTLTEDVLLEADASAAARNETRLRAKTRWVVLAASSLAVAIILLVAGMVEL
jgi:hypothetical protein